MSKRARPLGKVVIVTRQSIGGKSWLNYKFVCSFFLRFLFTFMNCVSFVSDVSRFESWLYFFALTSKQVNSDNVASHTCVLMNHSTSSVISKIICWRSTFSQRPLINGSFCHCSSYKHIFCALCSVCDPHFDIWNLAHCWFTWVWLSLLSRWWIFSYKYQQPSLNSMYCFVYLRQNMPHRQIRIGFIFRIRKTRLKLTIQSGPAISLSKKFAYVSLAQQSLSS